ncbi:MAG TPA: PilZ domain-containing protein [Polyangiaceae bacterium]|nr:PilZ domain-containing protein [Polyangiaceae bacterium]
MSSAVSDPAHEHHQPLSQPVRRAPEHRIHRRVPVGIAAWVVLDDQRFSAECVNVSMGGAAVRTDARVSTGNVVELELSLGTDGGSCSIKCEVVRATRSELGLRFMALDRASLEASGRRVDTPTRPQAPPLVGQPSNQDRHAASTPRQGRRRPHYCAFAQETLSKTSELAIAQLSANTGPENRRARIDS